MTKVLTVPEIEAIKEYADTDWWYFARAIEATVIKRLAAGVSVEPVGVVIGFDDDTGNAVVDHSCEGPYGPLDDYEGIYNLDQLNTAIAAARVQENERCAKLIEDEEEDGLPLETLANGIRSSPIQKEPWIIGPEPGCGSHVAPISNAEALKRSFSS